MSIFCADKYLNVISSVEPMKIAGKITQIVGLVIESQGPSVNLGDLCYICSRNQGMIIPAEVVGFRQNRVLLMPIGEMQGIGPGCEVFSAHQTLKNIIHK